MRTVSSAFSLVLGAVALTSAVAADIKSSGTVYYDYASDTYTVKMGVVDNQKGIAFGTYDK